MFDMNRRNVGKPTGLNDETVWSVGIPSDVDMVAAASDFRASQGFTISQARAFVAAAEYGNFTAAAASLGSSQPAISRSIKDMETALGHDLFVRNFHSVCLTDHGARLLPHARRLIGSLERASAFMAGRRAIRQGLLRVAADASVAPVIDESLRRTLRGYEPAASLEMQALGSEEAFNQVAQHRADFGLCGDLFGHADIRKTALLEAPFGLIVPPGCEVPETVSSLSELATVPLVRLADHTPVTRILRREQVNFPAYFDSRIVFSCLTAAFGSMRQKRMAVLATGIGASLAETQGMRFVPLRELLPTLTVFLISPRYLSFDPQSEDLRDLVRASVHQSNWHPTVCRLNRLEL